MQFEIEVVNTNNCPVEKVREASRVNETVFEKQCQLPSTSYANFQPDYWIFAYEITEDGKLLLGKLDLNLSTSTLQNHTIKKAKISNVGIFPFARHKHVGTELLRKATKLCSKNNFDYLYIFCDRKVVPFYKGSGFIQFSKENPEKPKQPLLFAKPISKRCQKNPNIILQDFKQSFNKDKQQ